MDEGDQNDLREMRNDDSADSVRLGEWYNGKMEDGRWKMLEESRWRFLGFDHLLTAKAIQGKLRG